MEIFSRNIFGLDVPQNYYCDIKGYRHNHSMMLVRVGKDELDINPFFITFLEVLYFEGVFQWKGADFRIASANELKKLLRQLGYRNKSLLVLLRHHKLFIVETETGLKIKILASEAEKSSDIPGGFHWLKGPIV